MIAQVSATLAPQLERQFPEQQSWAWHPVRSKISLHPS